MKIDETSKAKRERDRENAILDKADHIDRLVVSFLAELRVHVDLLRDVIEHKEQSR